jgi:hypothetical protein
MTSLAKGVIYINPNYWLEMAAAALRANGLEGHRHLVSAR